MTKKITATRKKLQSILDFLSKTTTRATYGAVANLLAISISELIELLDDPRPETSWVVNKETGMPGCPPGYPEFPCAPDLKANDDYIKNALDLAERMRKFRE